MLICIVLLLGVAMFAGIQIGIVEGRQSTPIACEARKVDTVWHKTNRVQRDARYYDSTIVPPSYLPKGR